MDLPGGSVSALVDDRDEDCAVVSRTGRAGIADIAWGRHLLEFPGALRAGRIIVRDLENISRRRQ